MGSSFNKPSESAAKDSYTEFISSLTRAHQVVIFSKTDCMFCQRAKKLFDEQKVKYHVIELDINSNCPNENCDQLTRSLMLQTRMRTVPQIFVNGSLIGGCMDLEQAASKNEQFWQNLTNNKN